MHDLAKILQFSWKLFSFVQNVCKTASILLDLQENFHLQDCCMILQENPAHSTRARKSVEMYTFYGRVIIHWKRQFVAIVTSRRLVWKTISVLIQFLIRSKEIRWKPKTLSFKNKNKNWIWKNIVGILCKITQLIGFKFFVFYYFGKTFSGSYFLLNGSPHCLYFLSNWRNIWLIGWAQPIRTWNALRILRQNSWFSEFRIWQKMWKCLNIKEKPQYFSVNFTAKSSSTNFRAKIRS